ncbi:putative uncharacterized protein [Pseudarthrobacter siccitolerans]|uniref:Uncharacterized protein n=1 Tax=Pseudarthrobacter siccitolerans TaxID=861266 RepID=A0A024H8R8_9MICC|nr:hypothetical protein [Pseudarthrobacter siccitolerans]CCQ48277.1 putative uncharacterized protein [Pseudarthrobacter siccitolerans]
MAAIAESLFQGALVLLLCGAVLVVSVAATVFQVRRRSLAGAGLEPERSDQLFWDLFLGSAVALPALLIPTLSSPWAGLFLAGAAVASGIAAYRGSPRLMSWLSDRRQRREYLPLYTAAQVEHSMLLERWRRYELDPAYCIDYPAMTDVRLPHTAAVIKAMREAEQLRAARHQEYPPAVERFGRALAAAEQAAGISAKGR